MDYLPIVVYLGNLSQSMFSIPIMFGLTFFELVVGLISIAIFTTLLSFFNK